MTADPDRSYETLTKNSNDKPNLELPVSLIFPIPQPKDHWNLTQQNDDEPNMRALFAFLALAAWCTTLATAELGFRGVSTFERQLKGNTDDDNVSGLCVACLICDAAGSSCNLNDVYNLVCTNCALIPSPEVCTACDVCQAGDSCDLNLIKKVACSVCSTTADDDDGGGGGSDTTTTACFSERATVQVLLGDDHRRTAMKDLKTGDRVRTMDGSYQEVYAFGHYHTTKTASFFQIYNEGADMPLEVTSDHLVFLQGKSSPVPAQEIQVGDVLSMTQGTFSAVTKISTVERNGIYAPLTTTGTLLVDGVATSSYVFLGDEANGKDHLIIHKALSPLRMVCSGVSPSLCDTRLYLENGMPLYVHWGLEFLHRLLNCGELTRTLGMSLVTMVAGFFQVLEEMFGARSVPLMVFLGVCVGLGRKVKSSKCT